MGTKMRTLAILGSTGSIGRQALSLVDRYPDLFRVSALTAHDNTQTLFEQVRKYRPEMAAVTGRSRHVPDDLKSACQWEFGPEALAHIASCAPGNTVLVSVVGMVGLRPVLAARLAGKRVLLANKEALVAGGALVMNLCAEGRDGPTLIPVDSEHSAIFQCLRAADDNPFERLVLTASGGPFRSWPREAILCAAPEEALRHPNWSMGRKISIDSATMFNKALEVIEARWLFDAQPEQIEVLIHPESLVHSMVVFKDGAVLAQCGVPDMRLPILYALAYPRRLKTGAPSLDLLKLSGAVFEKPDPLRFPALKTAYDALKAGGAACCVLNAANEVAVHAFLRREIAFGRIHEIVERTLEALGPLPADTLENIEHADSAARLAAAELCAG